MTETYGQIVARLASAQKKRTRGAPAYSIYVNRKAGRYLAAGAYKLGLSPNQVTIVSALCTFTAIVLIATIHAPWWFGIIIWFLLALGYAFDSADGQVARLRGGGSPSGEWLDHVIDATKISSMHLVVLIAWYRFYALPSTALLLIPLFYSIVAAIVFFAIILNEQLKKQYGDGAEAPNSHSSPLRALLAIPTDYGFLCVVFLFIGIPPVFFVLYTLMFIANAAYLLLALVKWFRDMRALGDAYIARTRGVGPAAPSAATGGVDAPSGSAKPTP